MEEKEKISVIQIGTNRSYDDLANYLLSNYDNDQLELLIFVEPNRFHNYDIKECYKKYDNIIIENIAIKPSTQIGDKATIFYRDIFGGFFETASFSYDHVNWHNCFNGEIITHDVSSFEVSCLSLDELLDKYSISNLDWILLDIEGIDKDVILSFNWEKYNIKRVEFEYIHLGEYAEIIKQKFLDMGYVQIDSLHKFDWAFLKKDSYNKENLNKTNSKYSHLFIS